MLVRVGLIGAVLRWRAAVRTSHPRPYSRSPAAIAMPHAAPFSLRLLDAESGTALEEHMDAQGGAWYQGEPGSEYFIELAIDWDQGKTIAEIKVDGKCIGYTFRGHGGGYTNKLGVHTSPAPGMSQHVALAFASAAAGASEADDDAQPAGGGGSGPPFGSVSVTWYRATDTGVANVPSLAGGAKSKISSWTAVDGNVRASGDKGKKKDHIGALKSTMGSTSEAARAVSTAPSKAWLRHEALQTLSLRYTSEFGLVVRGILQDAQPAKAAADADDDESTLGPLRLARKKAREEREAAAARAAAGTKDDAIALDDDDDDDDDDAARPIKRQAVEEEAAGGASSSSMAS